MKKKLILCIFFPFLFLLCVVHAPAQTDNANINDAEIAKREFMVNIVSQVVGTGRFTVLTSKFIERDFTDTLKGKCNFLGIDGVDYKALFNDLGMMINFTATTPASEDIGLPSFNTVTHQVSDLEELGNLFIPPLLRDRIRFDSYSMDFNAGTDAYTANASKNLSPNARFEKMTVNFKMLEDWQPLADLNVKVDKLTLGYEIKYPTNLTGKPKDSTSKTNRVISGVASGTVKWGDTKFKLSSNLVEQSKDWQLAFDVTNLSINDIYKLFNIDEMTGIPLPSFINQRIEKATLKLKPYAKEPFAELIGLTSLAHVNLLIKENKKEGQKSKYGVVAGFSLPQNFSFGAVLPQMSMLDNSPFKNAAFIYSTQETKPDKPEMSSLPIIQNLLSGDASIYKGLTFLMWIDLNKVNVSTWLNGILKGVPAESIIFKANFPANPADLMLEGMIDFQDNLNIANVFFFRNFRLQMKPTGGNPEFSLLADMDVKVDANNMLRFRTGMGFQPGASTVIAKGALVNDWNGPFGFKPLSIGGLSVESGLNFSSYAPFPLPDNMLFSGRVKLGPVSGEATVGLDVNEPSRNMIDAKVYSLSVNNIIDVFCSKEIMNKIPSFLKPYFESKLDTAEIKLVQPPNAVTTVGGKIFYPGYRIVGDGKFLGWGGRFEFNLEGFTQGSLGGLKARGVMDPIRLSANDFKILHITGAKNAGNPEIINDLSANHLLTAFSGQTQSTSPSRIVYINGGITILGVTNANALIDLTPTGFLYQLDGKVYGFLDASIDAQIKSFINPLENTYVKVEGKAGGLAKDLQKLLTKEILDLGFSLDRIYFAGRLDGLKTGAKAKLEYRVAGRNNSMDVHITVGGAADLAKQIAKEIGNVGGVVLKEIKDVADKAVAETKDAAEKAARDFANFTDESVRKTWNKSLKEIGDMADDFSGVIDKISGKTERKLIKINGPTYLIHTKFPGQVLHSESSKETEHHIYLGSYMNRLQDTWQIVPAGNSGYCYIVSAYSALNLNVDDHRKEDGAMIRLMKHKLEERNNERIKLVMVPNEVGWYYLQFQHSSKYATLSGRPAAKGNPVANTQYFIMAKHSNLTLETDGGNLRQNEQNSSPQHQTWSLIPAGTSDVFYIKHENTSTYVTIDVKENKAAPGQNVSRQKLASSPAQKFRLVPVGNEGYYKLVSLLGNNLVLDIKNASLDNGARMQAWTDNGNYAQHFYFVPVNRTRINQTSSTGDASKFRFEQVGTRTW